MKLVIDKELADSLKYVDIADKESGHRGNFPDFLIVGPQRTGTTWLTSNLRYHPEIFLSYPKELYYFNRLDEQHNKWSLHRSKINLGLLKKGGKALVRELIKIAYMDYYKTGWYKANQLEWYLQFFEDDDWVTRSIKYIEGEKLPPVRREPKVRGEATASYAVIEKKYIKEIISINPDIKIIFMIRDPVDRAWSHLKKDLIRDSGKKQVTVDEMRQYLDNEYIIKCGCYTDAMAEWKEELKPENLYIGMYKHIALNPEKILTDVYSFLGVDDSNEYVNPRKANAINKTDDIKMPEGCRKYLEYVYEKEKAKLAQLGYD